MRVRYTKLRAYTSYQWNGWHLKRWKAAFLLSRLTCKYMLIRSQLGKAWASCDAVWHWGSRYHRTCNVLFRTVWKKKKKEHNFVHDAVYSSGYHSISKGILKCLENISLFQAWNLKIRYINRNFEPMKLIWDDLGPKIPLSTSRIPDTRFRIPTQCIPDFKRPRFQNFIVSRIPDSKVHDSVQKLPGFCNPYYLPWGEINKIDISIIFLLLPFIADGLLELFCGN